MGGCLASSDGEKNPAPTVQAPQFDERGLGNTDHRLRRSLGSLGASKRLSQPLMPKKGRLPVGITAPKFRSRH